MSPIVGCMMLLALTGVLGATFLSVVHSWEQTGQDVCCGQHSWEETHHITNDDGSEETQQVRCYHPVLSNVEQVSEVICIVEKVLNKHD